MAKDRSNSLDVRNWQDLLTHDGAFAVDPRQRIVYWSASAEQLLGHAAKDVVGKLCYEILGGKDADNYRVCRPDCPVMANARRGRSTPDYDLLCAAPSGQEKRINVTVAVSRKNRHDFQILHLFRDVSERRRIEEFARKASTTLHQLLSEADGKPVEEVEEDSPPLPKLSRREIQVLRLLAAGTTTLQIAETLSIRPLTARNHVSRLLTKLGVDSRLQAVVYASRKRLI
jgi:PAS domain S-box-containing protein